MFPPCDTVALQQLQLDRKLKRLYLISVAQFRPEKNHRLQLEAFAHARQSAMQESCCEGESHSGYPQLMKTQLLHSGTFSLMLHS